MCLKEEEEAKNKMNIMFVCTGNTCRSAMAEALMKFHIKDNEKLKGKIKVYSCGIFAEDGEMSMYTAIEAMKEYGIDLGEHRATNIRNANIEKMDLILCATRSHKYTVEQLYPDLKEKIYTIKEYANYEGESLDIKDPWGYDIEIYRFCISEIEDCIQKIKKKL